MRQIFVGVVVVLLFAAAAPAAAQYTYHSHVDQAGEYNLTAFTTHKIEGFPTTQYTVTLMWEEVPARVELSLYCGLSDRDSVPLLVARSLGGYNKAQLSVGILGGFVCQPRFETTQAIRIIATVEGDRLVGIGPWEPAVR